MVGKEVKLNVVGIGFDDQAQALMVQDLKTDSEDVRSLLDIPHITLWTADKVSSKIFLLVRKLLGRWKMSTLAKCSSLMVPRSDSLPPST